MCDHFAGSLDYVKVSHQHPLGVMKKPLPCPMGLFRLSKTSRVATALRSFSITAASAASRALPKLGRL